VKSLFIKKKKKKLLFLILIILVVFVVFAISFYQSIARFFYPLKYKELVVKYSEQYGLDECLVFSIIRTESHFDEDAVSSSQAHGLMQITLETATWIAQQEEINLKEVDSQKLFDPSINIMLGTWYLDYLLDMYKNQDTAVAAYNAGSGNVNKWLLDKKNSNDGIILEYIPFGETRHYVKKVNNNLNMYKTLYPFGVK